MSRSWAVSVSVDCCHINVVCCCSARASPAICHIDVMCRYSAVFPWYVLLSVVRPMSLVSCRQLPAVQWSHKLSRLSAWYYLTPACLQRRSMSVCLLSHMFLSFLTLHVVPFCPSLILRVGLSIRWELGWGFRRNGIKHNGVFHLFRFSMVYIPFFVDRPTGQTGRRIFTHDGSNDAVSRKGQTFSGTKIRS